MKKIKITESQYNRLIKEQERKSWDMGDGKTGYKFDPQLDRELNDLVGGLLTGKVSEDEFENSKSKFFTPNAKVMVMYDKGGKPTSWNDFLIDDFIFNATVVDMFDASTYRPDGYIKTNDKISQLQIVIEPK